MRKIATSSNINLRGIEIHWEGIDSDTPPGHYLASGVDSLGNMRLWLFRGDAVSDDGYRGSLLYPPSGNPIAYGPRNGYVTSQGSTADMLARLAKEATP